MEPSASNATRKPVVLVVDDEASNLDLLVRTLQERYEVHGYRDPLQALTEAVALQPTLLVTDYRMPGLSGVELTQKLREQNVSFVAVLVTGYADLDDVTRALELKLINRVVAKPWRPTELRTQIDLALALFTLESRPRIRPPTMS